MNDASYPLTLRQADIFFDQLRHHDSPLYNVGGYLQLGRIDVERLRGAHRDLIEGCDIFGLRVAARDTGVFQYCTDSRDHALALIDLSAAPAPADAADAWLRRRFEEPIEFVDAPLFRAYLLKLGDAEYRYVGMAHHVMMDGWGFRNWGVAVARLYAGESVRQPFADWIEIAADDRAYEAGPRFEQDRAYWWDQSGERRFLPVHHGERAAGGRVVAPIPAAAMAALYAVALEAGAGIGTVLTHLVALYVARSYGQRGVLLGVPVHNRRNRAQKEMLGVFAGITPVGIDVPRDATWRDGIAELAKKQRRNLRHQRFPLGGLAGAAPIGEAPFDVCVNYLALPGDLRFDGSPARLVYVPNHDEKTPLVVTLWQEGDLGAAELQLDYRNTHFSEEEARALAHRLIALIETLPAQIDARIGAVEIVPAAERAQVVRDWNATAAEYPAERCIHELVEERARESPESLALVCGESRLSYAELDAAANRVAHGLRARGVGPDVRVGLLMERSVEMVVGLIGILKAGGAYVPLDPGYPPSRLAHVIEDSGCSVVLVQEALRARLAGGASSSDVLALDGDAWLRERAAYGDSPPAVAGLTSRHLAYVIYTSGSTGQPKGVCTEHRALVSRIAWMQSAFALDASDRVLQKSPHSFDISLCEFFQPLVAGATLVMARPEGHKDPVYLTEVIRAHGITTLHYVPSMLGAMLLDGDWRACTSVRRVFSGGEALPGSLVDEFRATGTASALYNLYGPTEAAILVSWWDCAGHDGGAVVPIGRPVANARLYVLDEQRAPLPIGVVGELYIGGAGVARGYLNRPELTAERFVADPFSSEEDAEARLYRTGDLARWLPEGVLEYVGRSDTQVKIRGHRIELGEIEAVLARAPGVREAAVMARAEGDERRLVAYVVPEGGGDVDESGRGARAAGYREYLLAQLPGYMVPELYVELAAMPLTGSGKVDRKALPVPAESDFERAAYVGPRTEIEAKLVALWQSVLKVERLGVEDDFFALGGHSLLATRLVSVVRKELGVEVPLRALFERPTVAAFAEALQALAGAAPVLPPIRRVERDGALPLSLSYAQQRLWFIDQLEGGTQYNMPAAFRLHGALDAAAFWRALGRIVERHEVLRTGIEEIDGAPRQVVSAVALREDAHDLSSLSPEERAAEVTRHVREHASACFDLSEPLKLRVRLLRLAADEHVALFNLHHIASDGWSMGVLVRELDALYAAYRGGGEEDPLPALRIQYADYAQWQRAWLDDARLDEELAYWRAQLAGLPQVHGLPLDHARPAVQQFAGAMQEQRLPVALTAELHALCRREGVTLFMLLQTALSILLGRYGQSNDVVIGTPVAGRLHQDVEGLVGLFVNSLVLRTELTGERPFVEQLARNRETILDAYAHQQLPFETLVESLRPERSLSYSPLFQVLLVLQNAGEATLSLAGMRLEAMTGAASTSKFDLELSVVESGEGLSLSWRYNTALFEAATIARWASSFAVLLSGITASPESRLDALPVLTDAEREQVVRGWNATSAAYPSERCIHQLFEEQAAARPDAIALEFDGETLAYGELNRRANRIAHRLVALGIEPDTRVAICVERGFEMIAGLLGILKAGGAYVPLDPEYPAARLRYLLSDCAPIALLTQSSLGLADTVFAGAGIPVMYLDQSIDQRVPETDLDASVLGLTASHLAYVIYTSGSTGAPKGAMNQHAAVVNRLWWELATLGYSPDDTLLQKASFSFDASVCEIFLPLISGRRLVLARPGGHRDVAYLVDLVARSGVTVAHFIPTMLQQFLEHLEHLERDDVARCAGLRHVKCGGEALPSALQQRFMTLLPGVALHNLYGPTEAAINVSHYRCDETVTRGFVPIGRPIANTQLYVLDHQRAPLPIGVVGELYIGGTGVARGYLDQPALTAEKFVVDPFSPENPAARLYRTGDLARWLPDGTLEYVGRIDTQIKIRGYRIELGEIESILALAPGVRDAAVVAHADGAEKRLVAYVVPAGDIDGSDRSARITAYREHLQTQLPSYMVPELYIELPAMPLTGSGKLDRTALPAPADSDLHRATYIAPRTETESQLAALWQSVLKLERVGIDDDFFALGGHSLLATRLVSLVRKAFGIEVPLRTLFERPTVAAFADALQTISGAAPVLPPIQRMARDGVLPLSYAQQRLWFIDQLEGGTQYNMPAAFRLRGALDTTAFWRALGRVVERHDVLRAAIYEIDGEPRQFVSAAPLPEDTHDLSSLDPGERAAEVARHVREHARIRFELSEPLKVRVRLLRLAADEHVALFNLHHIASDGWSMGVLVKDLDALYAAYRRGGDDPLPPLRIQYADYAQWQRAWLDGGRLDEELAYWRARLAGLPQVHGLPLDHPRPAMQQFAGATHDQQLPAALTADLYALCRREGVTLFMLLQTALSILLSRYSQSDDVVIGTPVAGRLHQDVEGLVGLFVNSLVLRTELAGERRFVEQLARNRETILDAYAHQQLPFETLVEALRPERSLSYSPLFQILLVLQNTDTAHLSLAGMRLEAMTGSASTSKFDLELSVVESGDGLSLSWDYNTALFDATTIARWSANFAVLLSGIVSAPESRLDALPVLSAAERDQVVRRWNATSTAYPSEHCIHELFAEQAARTPDAPALVYGDSRLTYRALNAAANRVAHGLRARGVGPEVRVGLFMERSVEMVVGVLGILKAGGAYVPLDLHSPPSRLAYVLDDSGCTLVLSQQVLRDRLDTGRRELLALDGDAWLRERADHDDAAPVVAGLTSRHLAYVIYTSGSTGQPKGVCTEHRALVNQIVWLQSAFGVDARDRVLQKAPYSFDASVEELFLPLVAGATLVMARPEGHKDPVYLTEVIREHGITTLDFVPSMLAAMLLDGDWRACASVRRVLLGGEALPGPLVDEFYATGTASELYNLYGPTEAAIQVTCWHCAGHTGGAVVPIGRPIANTQLYVLDDRRAPLPIGVPGELYIGGVAVARGYLNQPALTAERFVADPFSADPTARLYRTGDLARWLPDGTLEYVGRIDTQVKLRGFRIELGEIESVLAQAPGVRDVVVVARAEGAEKRLVAYVVPEGDVEESGRGARMAGYRQHLQELLPSYMVPELYVELAAMPLTRNGKLDRKALPAPAESDFDRAAYVPPRTEIEARLVALWQSVLKLERVSAEDSFFALGGHSLLATRLVSMVRKEFGVEVPLRALFERPTVAAFAEALQELSGAAPVLPPIRRVQRAAARPLSLSYAQQRLWFIDQLEGGTQYNMPAAFRLRGALDAAAFWRALGRVVERHEVLRTGIEEIDGAPRQVVSAAALPEDTHDLSSLDLGERAAEVARHVREHARARFDLSEPLKVRVRLLRLAADEHVALFNLHHIASDGWSMGVLVKELDALYAAYRGGGGGEEDPLPALRIQYADYAQWQREWLDGARLDEELAYWRAQLAGLPQVHGLPLDRARPAVQQFAGAMHDQQLPAALTSDLHALCRREGVTLFMLLQTALSILLRRYSQSDDVVIGTPVAGRLHQDVEGLVGLFVNSLVLRTELSGERRFVEQLARNRETILDAYAHQQLPFETLVETLRPQRSLAYSPLFQILLVLQNTDEAQLSLAGMRLESMTGPASTSKFDLELSVVESGDGLSLSWRYNTALFDAATIARWASSFALLLSGITASPESRLDALPMLSAAEREQLLVAWNATRAAYPSDRCIHQLFEEQAAARPDAIALEFDGQTLAYGELNRRANRIAHRLLALGVRPDTRVAICAERSPEMIAGLLGILKAGGAYVPLDPEYPAARLRYLLADSAPIALLIQSSLGLADTTLAAAGLPVMYLDRDMAPDIDERVPETDPDASALGLTASHLAYVIYTSGSTGAPKGAMNQHAAVVNRLWWELATLGYSPVDTLLQKASFSFDASVCEIFLPLISGRRLVLARPGGHRDVAYLIEVIARSGVTVAHFIPTMLQQFLEHLEHDDVARCAGLRHVKCGGEALPSALQQRFMSLLPGVALHNLYGPTEAAINVSHYRCDDAATHEPLNRGLVPIGRPIANTRLYVLDRQRALLPIGVVGELYIGGVGVARGYLDQPALTAEKFIADPFSDDPAARLYRTGDLARWLPDGTLEYVGRIDTQVKIRGYRIELGEIESTLALAPGVRDAAVVAHAQNADKRLVAYVVPAIGIDESGRGARIAAYRQHLLAQLPSYMVPELYVELAAMPLTGSGKLDRNALPAPADSHLDRAAYVAPRTETESRLAALWQSVLKLDRVGIDDDFFALGGHSLLATRLVSLVRKELGIELPLRTLFERPTVAGVADALRTLPGAEPVLPPIRRVSHDPDEATLAAVVTGKGKSKKKLI